MNLQHIRTISALTFGALGALSLSACGVGDDQNVGDSNQNQNGHSTGGSVTTDPGAGGKINGGGGASQGGASQGGASQGGTSGGGVACGKNTCGAGQYCCNASCGMCAPMGAACIQIACNPDPAPGACTTDSDCHTSADYCTGCDCRALGPGQTVPACNGPGVQCLVDACMNKTAACVNGACVLVSPLPTETQCQTDSDCSVVDDYCTGCDCRALGKGETLPKCDGPGVQCLVEPCRGKVAACVGGMCVAQ